MSKSRYVTSLDRYIRSTSWVTLSQVHANFLTFDSVGNVLPEGTKCWTAGWGTLASGGGVADNLQEVDVNIISDHTCSSTENADWLKPGKN